MSPVKKQLDEVKKKLGELEKEKMLSRAGTKIDSDLRETYKRYSILKIRYLMENV